MEQTIYVDVLLTVNFIVDYILIRATIGFLKKNVLIGRIIFGSIIASLSSLLIFLPIMELPINLIINLIISCIVLFIVFGRTSVRTFVKYILVFFTVNYLFAGCIFGIWIAIKPPNMLVFNGVLYLNIPPLILVGCIVVIYLGVILFSRIMQNRVDIKLYNVSLDILGKTQRFVGHIDTGNHLVEAFSNYPVLLCSLTRIERDIPSDLHKFLSRTDFSCIEEDDAVLMVTYHLRLIPYHAVGSKGLLPAILVENVSILSTPTLPRCYLGITKIPALSDHYTLLLSQQIFV